MASRSRTGAGIPSAAPAVSISTAGVVPRASAILTRVSTDGPPTQRSTWLTCAADVPRISASRS